MEFAQWLKKVLSEGKEPQHGYDAEAKRNKEDLAYLNKTPKLKVKVTTLSKSPTKDDRKGSSKQDKRPEETKPKETDLEFVKSALKSDESDAEIVEKLRLKFKINKHID